jgi:hypothetical protein
MNRLRDTKTVGLMALMACALYFSGFFVILTPLPLMYAMMVRGRRLGYAAAALAGTGVVAVYAFAMPAAGAVEGVLSYVPAPGAGLAGFMPAGFLGLFGPGYFAFFVAVAIALAWCAEKRRPLAVWGSTALLSGALVSVVALVAAKFLCEGSLTEGVHAFLSYVLKEVLSANEAAGMQNAQMAYLADNAEGVTASIVSILPALAFVYAVIAVAINIVLGRRFLKVRNARAPVPGVLGFKLPDWLIWAVIASGGFFFANSYVIGSALGKTVALNGLLCLGVLYFLQGMAVTSYFLQRIRFSLLRTVAYVAMIIFLQTVSVALIVLGIADVWADFRLRHLRMVHQQR